MTKTTKTLKSKQANGSVAAKRKKLPSKGKSTKTSVKGKDSTAKTRDPISREVATILYCGFALVLFVIFLMFSPTETPSGAGFLCFYISKAFAMLFGKGRFVLVFFLFYLAFLKWNRQKEDFPFGRCLVASTVLFLALTTFFNIDQTLLAFGDFMSLAASGNMGGIVGGIISYGMLLACGETVSVIILLLVILVSFVAVTGLSLFALIARIRNASGEVISKKKQEYSDKKARMEQAKLAVENNQSDGREEEILDYSADKNTSKTLSQKKIADSQKPGLFRRLAQLFAGKTVKEKQRTAGSRNTEDADKLLDVDFEGNLYEYATDPVAVDSFYTHLSGGEPPLPIKEDALEKHNGRIMDDDEEELDHSLATFETIDPDFLDEGAEESLVAVGEEPSLSFSEEPPAEADHEEASKSDAAVNETPEYRLPSTSLLPKVTASDRGNLAQAANSSVAKLERTLASFGVKARVTDVTFGPSLTRFEVQPGPGVKVSKIVNLADDIALQLAAADVRMEAPVPGKGVIGIEVPRREKVMVQFRDIIENSDFFSRPSKLSCAFGKDITGRPVIGDLAEMPHLLIAGTTGSGKSVCVNSIICSILFKATPDEVKFIMIDPKQVEFVIYEGLPHLITPVVTDPKKAAGSLKWVLREMENRYTLLNQNRVRNIEGYNALVGDDGEKMPQIVVFIDELADLMMVAAKDVEDAICRLAQKARAAGIHLVVATQRPSVDVITGLIKANMPSRIALSVSSQTDSRTILDMGGAEKLMGKGDMLYAPVGMAKPLRVQGAFLDEKLIAPIVEHCKRLSSPDYVEGVAQAVESSRKQEDEGDVLFYEAAKAVINAGQASTSMLQRRFRIGYNRAARLIEELQTKGVVGPADGARPRAVLISMEYLETQFAPHEEQQDALDI